MHLQSHLGRAILAATFGLAALPFIQSGKVRALAVTSPKRAAFAPDIPAISETAGMQSYSLSNWFGVSPDGRYFFALNEDSDTIVAFEVDGATGALTETGQITRCGSPVCMVFA